MDFLLRNTPTDVLSFELIPYLTLLDLTQLDIALTNICLRPQLLEVYPSLRLEHTKKGVDMRQLTWFMDRSIRLSNVALMQDLSLEEILEVATLLGSAQTTTLNVPGNKNITDVAETQGCPALTSLDLSKCRNITDAGVVALSQNCPALTTLVLSGCRNITDAGVVALSQGCPALTTLYLSGCRNITDAGVVALTQGCPALTIVGLTGGAV